MDAETGAESRNEQYAHNKDRIRQKIDEIIIEASDQGYQKVVLGVAVLAQRLDERRNWLYDNNWPRFMDAEYDSCNWQKYKGLIIDVQEYGKDRNLELETDTTET